MRRGTCLISSPPALLQPNNVPGHLRHLRLQPRWSRFSSPTPPSLTVWSTCPRCPNIILQWRSICSAHFAHCTYCNLNLTHRPRDTLTFDMPRQSKHPPLDNFCTFPIFSWSPRLGHFCWKTWFSLNRLGPSNSADFLLCVGVDYKFWLFIFTLNRAQKLFNSKLNRKYSFNKLFIQYLVGNINSKFYSKLKKTHSNLCDFQTLSESL